MLKYVAIYAITNLINAAVPFLLLPLLTNYLTPSEYGIVAMFQVLMSGLLPFVGFSSDGAISRQFFDKEKVDFANYITNSLYILLVSTGFLAILFIASGEIVERYSEFPKEWLWAVVLFAFSQKITEIILSLWRVQNKALRFGIFRILRTGLDMGLSIYFVIVLKRSWEGRIEGQVAAVAFFSLISIYYLYKGGYIKHGIKKDYIKGILNFGVPLIPHALGAIIITYSDRLFITNMVGMREMGLYSVGYQIGMIIYLIQNSFNQAWQPWLYGKIKKDDDSDKIKIKYYSIIYMVFILVSAFIISLLGPLIVKYMTDIDYAGSVPFISWIAFGFAFNGMYKMFVNYLFYFRKTTLIGSITFFVAALNIVLNYFLIKRNGSIGAAQASAISFFLQFLFVAMISSKYYSLNWFKIKLK